MRIAIVTHYMPPHIGGIELLAESLYQAYIAAGHEVRWIASRVPATAPAREQGRIRVGCLNVPERKLGVPWPVWGVEGARELARLVEWADVLHVHDCLYMGSALAVRLARRHRKPVLLTQHIGFVRYSLALLNGIERFANYTLGRAVLRGASHLVFATPAAEEFVSSLLNGRPDNATTIPNGIDTNRFIPPSPAQREEARRDLKLPDLRQVVLFVGRLVEKKGINHVVEVCKQMGSHHFLIIGDGPMKSMIPVASHNLTWLPHVPPEAMHKFYRAADLFLLPSHGEGLPIAVQEAMAAGLPVVISKDEVFAAALEREGACVAIERKAEAILKALILLTAAPEMKLELTRRARGMVEREWSLDSMAKRYLSLMSNLALKG